MNRDKSIIGLNVCLNSTSLNFGNVHMAYTVKLTLKTIWCIFVRLEHCVMKLIAQISSQWVSSMLVPKTCLASCFLASAQNLSCTGEIILSADSFTCVSDVHGSCRWLELYWLLTPSKY